MNLPGMTKPASTLKVANGRSSKLAHTSHTLTSANRDVIVIGAYLVALVMDVDRFPGRGETLTADNFRQTFGGKGSNMAVQLARLGKPVRFAGCVGQDAYGDHFAQMASQEGVDLALLSRKGELPTGAGFIVACRDGHNSITIDIGVNRRFDRNEIDKIRQHFRPTTIVITQHEILTDTALYAAQQAHQQGAFVICNPAPAEDLTGQDLSCIDILTPNETEARVCLGLLPDDPTDDAEIARRLLTLGVKTVLMTVGARGCILASAEGIERIPGLSLDQITDTTGAGDAFNAALAAALIDGKPLREAAAYANVVAGLSTTRANTIPSYHTHQEVTQFLASVSTLV